MPPRDCIEDAFRSASASLRRCCSLAGILLALTAVAGCERLDAELPASQVAAQVNSDEITVRQVNAALARATDVTPELAPRARREVLDRLIDRKLAVQEARRRKLDRSPEVLRALEAAREDVLAQALAEDIARGQPKPTAEEVKEYYEGHPELFARRRVFVLEEIGLADANALMAELKDRTAKASSMRDIAAWLRSRGARFTETRRVRAAEQLPLERLPRLHAMKDGEMRLFDEGAGRLQVVRVDVSRPAPVDEATAARRIGQYLFNRRASEAVAGELKRIKGAAKIQYVGEFAVAAAGAEGRR